MKGAAAAALVYPDAGLRPMRDIDILTRPALAPRLIALLKEIGYLPEAHEAGAPESARHLPALDKDVDGFKVSVEVHDTLFDPIWRMKAPEVETLIETCRPCTWNDQPARTLALEDMLWHTYQHMINEEIRLIGIADMIGLAEKYVDELDWEKIWRFYPAVPRALALFHSLAPLDARLLSAARLPVQSPGAPLGEDLHGWPRISLREARGAGWGTTLRNTFLPSEWWLRLYFGLDGGPAIFPYRWIFYPAEVLRLALRHLAIHLWPVRG